MTVTRGTPKKSIYHAEGDERSVPGTRSHGSISLAPAFSRALITGAGGFVGRYLRAVLEKRLTETKFICTTRKGKAAGMGPWFTADLTDRDAVNALVSKYCPDLVVHLAAQSSAGLSTAACGETWRVNVCGSIILAEALASHSPHVTVLNVSSAEVYGHSFLDGAVTEYSALRPMNVYGRAKAAAESAFNDILPETARLITVRPFNHTGPEQDERFVVPSLAAQIVRIEHGEQAPPLRVGNLNSERDFLDVRDVIRAYVGLIEHAQTLPMRSVFNIATGRAVRISEILSRLQAMAKRAIPVEQDPARMRASDIPCAVGYASAIHSAIGWTPEIGLDQTLNDILEAMRTLPSVTSAQKPVSSADHSKYEAP